MNESRLYEILKLKRGHGSIGVERLIEQQLLKYNPKLFTDPTGERLAYVIQVGPTPAEGGSRSLFSCHIDSVHGRGHTETSEGFVFPADDEYINDINYDKETNKIHAKGDVLGADDGAGIWLLLEMIDAGIPASYVLHFGEECGGIGSKGMAQYHDEWLSGFERAIAFDRKGTHSVITHQGWGRCCSNDFASRLAEELNCGDYFFAPDDTGLYTDTAEYTDIIGECTNVSCGYYNEHTARECLDVEFLTTLRDRLLLIEWEALPSVRLPGEPDDSPVLGTRSTYWADEEEPPYLAMLSHWELLQLVEQGNSSDVVDLIMELVDAL